MIRSPTDPGENECQPYLVSDIVEGVALTDYLFARHLQRLATARTIHSWCAPVPA
jgi:hypothetical protein